MAQQSYKKFVASAATATLVASALIPVASANVTTSAFTDVPASYKDAVDFVVSNNISAGLTATSYGVNSQIKRVDAAVMIAAAAGMNDKDAPASGFKDVPARAAVAVNSLKAAGVVNGKSTTNFGSQDNITRGEAAIMLQKAFDLKAGDTKNSFTDVKDSYDAAVDALVANKVTSGINATQFGTGNPIKRGDFAKFLFALKDQIVVANAVETVTVVNETTTTAKLKVANKELTAADFKVLVDGEAVTPEKVESDAKGEVYTITHASLKGKKGIVSVNGKQAEFDFVSGVQVESVKATNAKTLTVKFTQPVDSAKAVFEVKKGNVTANVSKKTFSEDGKTVTLEMATKLTAGDYTVAVSGLTDKALSETVKVENEKVAEVKVLSDKAAMSGTDVTVAYQVLNQYGEDITKAASTPSITWTASKGTATDDNQGKVTIAGSANTFSEGDKVVLTGIESVTGTVSTATLTVSSAAVADVVTIDSLYNADKKELFTNSTFGDFKLLFDAKDQYGNKIDAAKFNNDVIVTSSNPAIVDVVTSLNKPVATDNQGPNKDKIGLALKAGSGLEGTATITVITKATGKVTQYQVTVKKASAPDVVTISNPADVVAAGETVEIPLSAIDQYGKELTKYSELNGKVTLSATSGTLALSNDYVNNKAVLKYTAPNAKGTYVLMAVTPSGKVSQINVEVKEEAKAAVVAQVKDVKTSLNKGATTTVKASNFVVQDQYGRTVSAKDLFADGYKLKLDVKDGNADKVTVAGTTTATISATTDTVTLAGLAKGTEEMTVTLLDNANAPITSSELDFTVSTVETTNIASFEVAEIPTIHEDGGTGYTTNVDVYGVLADGSKVVLPASQYTITTTIAGLTATGKTLDANGVVITSPATEVKGEVIIVIEGENGPVTVKKPVTVSNVAPKIVDLTAASTEDITITSSVASGAVNKITLDNIVATVAAEDQYEEDVTASKFKQDTTKVTFTNFVDADESGTVTFTNGAVTGASKGQIGAGLTPGDSFNATFVTAEGKTLTLKVIVKAS